MLTLVCFPLKFFLRRITTAARRGLAHRDAMRDPRCDAMGNEINYCLTCEKDKTLSHDYSYPRLIEQVAHFALHPELCTVRNISKRERERYRRTLVTTPEEGVLTAPREMTVDKCALLSV